MFWRMAGLSTVSPVETILDKENFTLDELLDEDEIIQECKVLNSRLIYFLRDRAQVEQLIRYIVEEAPENSEKDRTLKFPFIACEIFTCEVDIILEALVEDEELMNLLFSFLEPEHPHSTVLAGYFCKVVVCLLMRRTVPLMRYIQVHQEIIRQLVNLIGITSITEILIHLIGAHEHLHTNQVDSIQWLEDMDVLEMIVDKLCSSDCPKVHANAAETLSAVSQCAPPGLASKISSPSFIGRLFRHALEESRPKSALVNLLSVCISLLDPKRLTFVTYPMFSRQLGHGSVTSANPETVESMLESLGDLLKILNFLSEENVLLTTYGKLQPPFGLHRLKIIEFISVLVAVSGEAAEKELIQLGAVKSFIELFFWYPYNNFLHHHVEHVIVACLESNNTEFIDHILHDCNLVEKILEAEKNFTVTTDPKMPTAAAEGRSPLRIGNFGHLTHISNKLVQLGSRNCDVQAHLQKNSEWVDWHTNVLSKRNMVENVYQWTCGRPTSLHDRAKDSDDDGYQDRDYDVTALANNLSQAFQYGFYSNDNVNEGHDSHEQDNEDAYFNNESAEVVTSSLALGDFQESGSLFTNSNWFAIENDRSPNEISTGSVAFPSPNIKETSVTNPGGDDGLADTATSDVPVHKPLSYDDTVTKDLGDKASSESDKPSEWVEWRENLDSVEPLDATVGSVELSNADGPAVLLNSEVQEEL